MSETPLTVVVIDTQLFLRAALNERSLPARLIFELGNRYILATSSETNAEVKEVLNRPRIREKYPHLDDEITERILTILSNGQLVTLGNIPTISRDPKDNIFLATAEASNADYLVSEDQDLLVLQEYNQTQIINATQFLHILQPAAE